jgi:hypothetical protein
MRNLLTQDNKGFVALFTVLIAAVVLAMAVSIANISLKQIILSASSTDANKSFYAADSGIECALYQDIRGTTPNSFDTGNTSQFNCNGYSIDAFEMSQGFFTGDTFDPIPGFQVRAGVDAEACAYVTVEKDIVTNATRIVSRGMNAPCGTINARTTERAIEVTY